MKKLSAIAGIFVAVFAILYFSTAAMAGKADTAPSLSSPANNYVHTSSSTPITFQFSLGSYDKVRLMIDDNSNFSSPLVDLETDQTSEQQVIPSGSYSWKIKGIDGQQLESEVRTFTVQ